MNALAPAPIEARPSSRCLSVVETSHPYAVDPDRLWTVASDWQALGEVNRGMVSQYGLPEGRFRAGQTLEIEVSGFGLMPRAPYVIEILDCDDRAWVMTSREHGAGIRSWEHRMWIEPMPNGCRLMDRVEIDAGPMTLPFALWARALYARRHPRRQRLLDQLAS